MPRYNWNGEGPIETTPYKERINHWGGSAVCFHCRQSIRLDDERNFQEHWDSQRDNFGRAIWYGRNPLTVRGERVMCPGTGTAPIPLAYKFPDGSRTPWC